MNKSHEKVAQNTAGRSKPRVAATRQSAPEQLAAERAEGEGMIAPAPTNEKASELEGEGSYSAARRYDEGLQRSVAKGDAGRLAEEAARALDGPEGTELKKAEQVAKRGRTT